MMQPIFCFGVRVLLSYLRFWPVLCVVRFWHVWFWLGNIWCVMLRVYWGYGLCDVIIFFFCERLIFQAMNLYQGACFSGNYIFKGLSNGGVQSKNRALGHRFCVASNASEEEVSTKWLPRERMSTVLSHGSSLKLSTKRLLQMLHREGQFFWW